MTTFREFQKTHDASDGIVLQTLPVAARALQGERAGLFTRTIAAVIDVVVVGAIIIGLWIAIWLFLLVFNPLVDYGMPRPGYFVLGGYFLMWLYWTWTWTTSGRSLGQNLMGVRVLDRKGQRPSWKVASIRAAFCVIFQVGILWILVSRRNRSVQDVVLRTSVVHDWTTSTSAGQVAPLSKERSSEAERESRISRRATQVAETIDHAIHRDKTDTS